MAGEFEEDEGVGARAPERGGGVEGALRSLVGVAAEEEAVEPEQAAAPAGEGEEGVGGGVEVGLEAVEGRVAVGGGGGRVEGQAAQVGEGERADLPVVEALAFVRDAAPDALAVVELGAVVGAAERLDQDVQGGAGRRGGQREGGAGVVAVEGAEGLPSAKTWARSPRPSTLSGRVGRGPGTRVR